MSSRTVQSGPNVTSARAESTPAASARRTRTKQIIDLGEIEFLQVLDEQGVVHPKRDPQLEPTELLRVYRAMVLTRKLDQRMLAMQRQGKMGTFAPGLGQEATQIGQVYPLSPIDWYSPSYRSLILGIMS